MQQSTENKSLLQRDYYGMPIWLLGSCIIVIYIATFLGLMPDDDMLSIMAIMFSIGLVLYEIGERLPIWNDYLGGGSLLAFLGGAVLEHFEVLPVEYSEGITFFYDDYGFQTLFISLLIVSAVLGVNRKQLIKAFAGYVPAILGGVVVAAVLGVIAATIVGIDVRSAMSLYVLPTMGGGNGAGAIPLSEMWEATTGESKDSYYSQAIAILTLANNFAILAAVGLNALGNKFPQLTGNGELLKNPEKYVLVEDEAPKPKVGPYEIAGGLMLVFAMYTIARTFSKHIFPGIGSVTFHTYAYLVVFAAIFNVSNIIPATLKEGSKKAANFLTKPMMCMCMVGIGIAFTDLADLISVLNFQTLFISAFVIIGAVIGSGIVGMMVGFNFVESAITAGLCMANRGGSGDLQVLGAAKRMNLMSYAQISSRIGGAIILVIASFAFGLM